MRKHTLIFVALLAVLAPANAFAQSPATEGNLSVAPFVGAILDTSEDWLLLGGEARLKLADRPFQVNPRLTFNPYEGGSMMQLDVNLLHNYALAGDSRFRPYVGIGGAFNRYSFDDFSESAVGLNLVSGARLRMAASRFEPFLNAQYTIIRDQGNLFMVVVGATITLR